MIALKENDQHMKFFSLVMVEPLVSTVMGHLNCWR